MDVDYILTGAPTTAELVEFFNEGYGEEYTVPAIKKHLRTQEQKEQLDALDLSIHDVLNGRFSAVQEAQILLILEAWNQKLGKKVFGF